MPVVQVIDVSIMPHGGVPATGLMDMVVIGVGLWCRGHVFAPYR